MITPKQFDRIFPACAARVRLRYFAELAAAMREAKINTRKRAAAFFAQLGHESHDFRFMEEIASGAAYEGRRDLGNLQPGDGRRFKGRGPIQITGRLNYTRAGIALGLPLHERPELLSISANGFRASAWFWTSNKLNIYADALAGTGSAVDLQRFDKITRRVNGGYNGRDDRRARYLRALAVLSDADFTSADATAQPQPSPAPSPDAAIVDGTPAQPAPSTPSTSPAQPSPAEGESLLDEIPITEETKATAGSVLRRLGVRLGALVVTIWGSGITGRVSIILAVVGLLVIAVVEWKRIKPRLVKLARKVFAK